MQTKIVRVGGRKIMEEKFGELLYRKKMRVNFLTEKR